MNKKTFFIAAAGTGGHVFPALIIAKKLAAQGHEIIWVGTVKGCENSWVKNAGFNNYLALNIRGLRSNGILGYIVSPWLIALAISKTFLQLKKYKKPILLGFGGYVTGPAGIAAKLSCVPLIIHEQNSIAGKTNKILAKFADRVLSAYAKDGLEKIATKHYIVGNPIDAKFFKIKSLPVVDRINILVLGGSLGAQILNQTLPKAVKNLDEILSKNNYQARITITHQTGANKFDATLKDYSNLDFKKINFQVIEFINNMPEVIQSNHLIISRAGAITVEEIKIASRLAIFVPFRYAVDDHQNFNAQTLINQGYGTSILEQNLTPTSLAKNIWDAISDTKNLATRLKKLESTKKTDAGEKILELISSNFLD